MLMEDRYPSRLRPFVSEVALKSTRLIGSNVRPRRGANTGSKMWTIEEVQSEVEAAVRIVIAMENNSIVDMNLLNLIVDL